MGSIVSSIFGGGSSRSAPAPSPSSGGQSFQTSVIREAPGIEERKIELMDLARAAADRPVSIPAIGVAPFSQLEQTGFTQAGQTGAGLAQLLAAQTPNIAQFQNPFQAQVIDEINRQAQQAQNALSARAVRSGAFGGGREGVASAELERARLGQVGLAQAQGFDTALRAAQQQQQTLGNLGVALQRQQQGDIQQLLGAGGLQRQLAQQTLDAARQSQLQQAFEPFQRAEFLSNIYAAGPKSQSTITAATQPQTSPLAQSIGAGLGAFTAFQGFGNNQGR
mgnify:FL=1|tara:strand:+ start:7783 stop:8619 length:837 start_codon:yes stop_codon:yes gene_type:complete